MTSIGKNLVVLGHVGCDVYLTPSRAVIRHGGSAFNLACGAAASGGAVACLGTIGPHTDRSVVDRLGKQDSVRMQLCPMQGGTDHVFVFRDPGDAHLEHLQMTLGKSEPLLSEQVSRLPFDDYHFHIGAMGLAEARGLVKTIVRSKPRSSLSCNLYLAHLYSARDWKEIIEACRIVFVNQREFEKLRSAGLLGEVAAGRMLIVTAATDGAAIFVDGVPTLSHATQPVEAVCPIGAGDVFTGAFLGRLCRWRDPTDALVGATALAAISVTQFGVEHVVGERARAGRARRGPALLQPGIALEPLDQLQFRRAAYSEIRDATGIFARRGPEILLARKPDSKAFVPGVLYVPGGKIKPPETPEQCARREFEEETGLHAGRFAYCGSSVYQQPGSDRLYRFWQYRVDEPMGSAVARDDIQSAEWYKEAGLSRSELFELTWAQLWLDRVLGQIPEPAAPESTRAPERDDASVQQVTIESERAVKKGSSPS